MAGKLDPPTNQLQLSITPPQGFDTRLAVTLAAEKTAQFSHRADGISEGEGCPDRRAGDCVAAIRSRAPISRCGSQRTPPYLVPARPPSAGND